MTTTSEFLNDIFSKGLERVGIYYGTYRGFVVDNQDPEEIGRLRLQIPTTTGRHPMKKWAFPKGMYSGPGYGAQIIPEKGDTVWVEFEYGNPHTPLWIHGHPGFNGEENERQEQRFKDIKNYWFRSPKGHTVEFYDRENLIRVTHSNGENQIYLEDGQVTVDYGNGIQMILDDQGIHCVRNGQGISLGKHGTSDEPATLGSRNSTLHLDTLNQLKAALTALQTYAGTQTAITAPTSPLTPLQAGYQTLNATIGPLIGVVDTLIAREQNLTTSTKSRNVTVDR